MQVRRKELTQIIEQTWFCAAFLGATIALISLIRIKALHFLILIKKVYFKYGAQEQIA